MKPKRRMNETQIEKKAQGEANRIDQFQKMKWAEELTNGMALRNAALKPLAHKIKEEEIITVSAKAEGEEAATWAAKCSEQKQQYPSLTPSIQCIPRTPSAPGCQNGKARGS